MQQSATGGDSASLQAFVGSAMRNIVNSLANLRAVVENIQPSGSEVESENWPLPHPATIREVLHETVATLERTKSAFKSKELGALRRKLEDVLKN